MTLSLFLVFPKGKHQSKKIFWALPKLPAHPNLGNLVVFFGRQKQFEMMMIVVEMIIMMVNTILTKTLDSSNQAMPFLHLLFVFFETFSLTEADHINCPKKCREVWTKEVDAKNWSGCKQGCD